MNNRSECEQHQGNLLAWELTTERREAILAIMAHLRNCPECRCAAADYEELRSTMAGPPRNEAREAIPPGGWVAFEGRMRSTLLREVINPMGYAAGGRRGNWHYPWKIAAALVLVAGLGLFAGTRFHAPTITDRHALDVDSAKLSVPELQQNVQAFDNIAQVFEQRASWVMFADGGSNESAGRDSDVGIVDQPLNDGGSPLVLRLIVKHDWVVVSRCDLSIVAGQSAEMGLNTSENRKLNFHVRTDRANRQRVSILLELGDFSSGGNGTLPEPSSVSANDPHAVLATTTRLELGVPTGVGQIMTPEGIYSLALCLASAGPVGSAARPGAGAIGTSGTGASGPGARGNRNGGGKGL